MRKIFLFLLLIPFAGFSQFTDDFSDGNFTSNPAWSGETTEFEVNTSDQLHLNATVVYTAPSDTAYLSTANTFVNNTEWQFWVKQSFASSVNNHGRFYLVSDQANLEGSLNGYFVQLGDIGDGKDSISLFKQAGAVFTKIIAGTIVFTNNSTNTFSVKVTRDNLGNWALYSDPAGGTSWLLEGGGSDNTFTTSAYCGVFCSYTSSNDTKFYFDNIYVGPIIIDTTPPVINSVLVISTTQLDISFSETVSTVTAETITNYSVDNSIGNPATAVKDAGNGSLVHLTFSTAFSMGITYTITISNVQDLSSNTMITDYRVFALYTPGAYDVVINEIMADPDPPVGLPNYEFLEIYNRAPYALNLLNWKLTVGTSDKIFPSVIIEADSFLILTSSTAVTDLSAYGPTVGFSSFSLTNTGTTLTLRDSLGHIIHTLSYTDSWYHDGSKDDGGWTIEQMDPSNPCAGETNWNASMDASGGTPGKTNSIFTSNPDADPPQLSSINVLSSTSIQLNFSEPLDSATLINPLTYSIDNSIGNPISVDLVGPDYSKVLLALGSSLVQNIIYTCTVTDTISDCAGNTSVSISKVFALYNPVQFDVVINEIMADPDPSVGLPDYEYVELYNRTGYPISMKNWMFGMGTTVKQIPDVTIDPYSYILLTESGGQSSLSFYGTSLAVTSFTISNEGEALTLYDSLYRVISSVSFTIDWYRDNYKEDGGWSLEQIDPLNPCGGAENWKASTGALGGTPGTVNSVNASNPDNTIPELVRVSLINNNSIQVYFSEPMDSLYLLNILNYSIDNSIGNPITAYPVAPGYISVILDFTPSIQVGTVYTITITDTLRDCVGNMLAVSGSARFAIPQTPLLNDVVINEILSNPKDDGVDYVELYNRSSKVIDLKELVLSSYDTITSTLTDIENITNDGYLLFPAEFVVLTTDPAKVKSQYTTLNPNWFIQMATFPSYNNDDGIVVLSLKNQTGIIDMLTYTADMQYALLSITDGVSLERINYDRPSDDKTNWHSAAETAGFGTPTFKNSQYSEGVPADDPVSVSPEIFSPDNDGYNDVLNINYAFETPGYMLNVTIYDASGRLVRSLIKNVLLGTSGTFSWDGITDDNEKARIGIYVVYFEVFDLEGNVKHY
ncbi:MAG: lamin tail domain-containing protein, partial [Bacteroidota bacterium]